MFHRTLDDVVLFKKITNNRRGGKEARRMEAIEERGLKISRKKTECWSSSEQQDLVLRLEGEEVKRVKTFKYLGSTLAEDGELNAYSIRPN